MRIANKKRFLFSCIFFAMLMLLFSSYHTKYINIFAYDKNVSTNYKKQKEKSNLEQPSQEFLVSNLLKTRESKSIVLDPGHGGVDKGTSIGNLYEKDINLKIALYAKKYLEKKGLKVFMTREEDVLVQLKEIGNFVNKKNPQIFVSIHVNSFKEEKYKGMTTYYYDVNGFQEKERIKFANIVQKYACGNGIWYHRGIRRKNLAVLRYSKVPCALVECGFITNREDRERLKNEKTLKITGENIAKGIIAYLKEKDN